MTTTASIPDDRAQLLKRLFPNRIPVLWCPLLTHYRGDGTIDSARMAAHLEHLSPFVKGFLIPGSTGDGWEMRDAEIRQLLEIAIEECQRLDLNLLIGVLKTDAREVLKTMEQTVEWLGSRASGRSVGDSLATAKVCGFTVCAPRGKELSQEEIEAALVSVLETGLPIAVYQLPQITQNEIGPELVSSLARRFANFILFKDTSGADRVVLSERSLAGVFTVRGAEGDYARWLNSAGGPYHGFLLSTANCFARELHQIIDDISEKRLDGARQMASRLTSVVAEVFQLVSTVADGNPFANGNKAMDHFFAHGPRAADISPPRLHAGSHLPVEVIRATGEALSRHGLMPNKGYLE
jgi:dihydrodipicolinate synthase/N-acetylneuraminate lyase